MLLDTMASWLPKETWHFQAAKTKESLARGFNLHIPELISNRVLQLTYVP